MPLAEEILPIYQSLEAEFAKRGVQDVHCFGGFACWLCCRSVPAVFGTRPDMDLDLFATGNVAMWGIEPIMKHLGFIRQERDTHRPGTRYRFLRREPAPLCRLDLYRGSWHFSHHLNLGAATATAGLGPLSVSDLLLSKLQIHEPEAKHLQDIAMLLFAHDLGTEAPHVISESRIAGACCRDWGLHRDAIDNLLAATVEARSASQNAGDFVQAITKKAGTLAAAIRRHDKTPAWRIRSWIGDRRSWWTDVTDTR